MVDDAEYFRAILGHQGGGFISVDHAGIVVYGNPTAGRILHLPIGAVIGRRYDEALSAFAPVVEAIRAALERHETVHRGELRVAHGDAEMFIGYSTLHVRTPGGVYLGAGITFQDLTLVLARKKKAAAD